MSVWEDGIKNITRNIAQRYKSYKDEGRDYMIDDNMIHSVAEGAYLSLGGTVENMKEGSKPYYDYLKSENNYKGYDTMSRESLMDSYTELAKKYKKFREEGWYDLIDDNLIKKVAEGAYMNNGGFVENKEEGYKPYYDYLKEQQDYTTPYSFEYEPYFSNNNYSITFDHEVDTSDSIQMIEELYNEEQVEEDIDSNDVINIVAIITNRLKNTTKKKIIHYISNYRPIMNVHSKEIKAVLIE